MKNHPYNPIKADRDGQRAGANRKPCRAFGVLPVFSALLVAVLVLPACVSQRMGTEVPGDARIVGGGRVVTYEAVTDGILFLVDQRDLIASQTIHAGEVYEVNGSVELSDGSTIELLESRLYFLPHDAKVFEEEVVIEVNNLDDGDHADLHEALDPPKAKPIAPKADPGKAQPSSNSDELPDFDQLEDALGKKKAVDTDAVSEVPTDQ